MKNEELHRLTAVAAAEAIRSGIISSEALVRSCLGRIDEVDAQVQAWAHLDPEYALAQARAADEARQFGKPLGALHGVPVGIKDIIDTADMPTERGTVLCAGRQPAEDAFVVSRLREAGAVILGKTVTTELAVYHPGKTRNPHDPQRTPGGSSSGSAAAVAAMMVPLAIGSQTNGSVIRPASFCGTLGFKPSHGLVPRVGVMAQSAPLDHLGVFARSVEDVALVTESLAGFHERDPHTRPRARPALLGTARQEPPMEPNFAFVKTPVWGQAEADTQAAFAELCEFLGPERVSEVALDPVFDAVIDWHREVMEADLARSFARYYAEGGEHLSEVLRGMIERGQRVTAVDYNNAVACVPRLGAILGQLFEEYDAILTPATPGQAPLGLQATGSPAFCTIWSFCGTPAITLPLLSGADGMPIGVQRVSAAGDDARLLRTARWLAARVAGGTSGEE